jgi:hypothetical protein
MLGHLNSTARTEAPAARIKGAAALAGARNGMTPLWRFPRRLE